MIIAKDIDQVRENIASLLYNKFNIYIVKEGQEVLDKIRELGKLELLITYIDMSPGMSGSALVKNLRLAGFNFPIIVYSANSKDENLIKMLYEGSLYFMDKNVYNTEEVAKKAEEVLKP